MKAMSLANRLRLGATILILALPLCSPAANGAATVSLATLDWEPYIGQNLENQGYAAEIVREAFRRTDTRIKISFYPWARVVAMARAGSVDGYFPEYFSEELKTNFLVSDPFPGGPLVFFTRKVDAIRFKTLADLKAYRFGVVRGYVNTAEFDAADFLSKDPAVDDLRNLRKLLAGRVDIIPIDKFVAGYLLKKHFPAQQQVLEFMKPPLEIKSLFLCISRQTPGAQEKLDAFNKGLKQIKADGTIDAVRARHGLN